MLAFAASGLGRAGVGGREPGAPRRQGLACSAGKFGERWIGLGEAYGADLVRYEPGWGARLDPAEIDRLLTENAGIEVAFATLSETSTGVVHDIEAIAEVAKRHGVILAVDAVSGLGAAELRQDDWGVDVVVAGSQKALMCPPGLAFASVSERALEYADAPARPGRFYFDWGKTAQEPAQGREPVHARRVAVPRARRRARPDRGGGPGDVLARHELLARATRAGVAAIGLELFGDPDERSTVVTAVELPDDIDGSKVPARCASSASPPTAARTTSRAASCGSPTAATSAPSTSSPRSPAWRWCWSSSAATSSYGAAAGAAQKVFLEAGVPAAA